MIVVTTEGIEDAIQALQKRGQKALTVLEPPLRRGALRIEAGLKVYPAQGSGARYRRTGTLGRRWTTRSSQPSPMRLEVEVGNNTLYGPYVQSKERQAAVHRGRWQTDVEVAEQNTDAIIEDVRQSVTAAMES